MQRDVLGARVLASAGALAAGGIVTSTRPGGVLEGAAIVGALGVVPLALLAALRSPVSPGTHLACLVLVIVAVVAWAVVVRDLARLVVATVRGRDLHVDAGPLAWAAVRVAALVLVLAPFLESGGAGAHARGTGTSHARPRSVAAAAAVAPGEQRIGPPAGPTRAREDTRVSVHREPRQRGGHRGTGPINPLWLGSGATLVPLAAELRRRARTGRRIQLDDPRAIDVETILLGVGPSPAMLLTAVGRSLFAAGHLEVTAHVVVDDGTARLDDGTWTFDPAAAQADARCLLVALGEDAAGTHLLYVPRGSGLWLGGTDAASLLDDAVRVSPTLGLGRIVRSHPAGLLHDLAVRADDELVLCDGADVDLELRTHCIVLGTPLVSSPGRSDHGPVAEVGAREVRLGDGRVLVRATLSATLRSLLDGQFDRPMPDAGADPGGAPLDDRGVVVRLLTAIPRVDGLDSDLEADRERRAVELVAYLALRAGEPVTGDRLRVRVLGTASTDAAAKTLSNIASSLRRSLGDGPFGPRLPPAGRVGHYAVAADVLCDVTVLHARAARARSCTVTEERIAWLRAALELVEAEPFATVLEGYDWFLAEGHLSRLQTVCEDVACELVELSLAHGLLALAGYAVERARLVDPYSERLAEAAARVAAARQASFEAIAPAARSTEPSAPVVT